MKTLLSSAWCIWGLVSWNSSQNWKLHVLLFASLLWFFLDVWRSTSLCIFTGYFWDSLGATFSSWIMLRVWSAASGFGIIVRRLTYCSIHFKMSIILRTVLVTLLIFSVKVTENSANFVSSEGIHLLLTVHSVPAPGFTEFLDILLVTLPWISSETSVI